MVSSALAIVGNDLLIATAKGESTGRQHVEPIERRAPKERSILHSDIDRWLHSAISLADIDKNLAA